MRTTKTTSHSILPGRVVITHGRSLHALAVAHSLASRGIEVIGGDETPLMAMSFSNAATDTFLYAVASEGEEAFIESLLEACQRFRPKDDRPYVLMPIHQDTQMIARHAHRFESFMKVATPSWDSIRQVDPKHCLIETARANDIPIPSTIIIRDREGLEEHRSSISYPAYVKRTHGSGGVGIQKVIGEQELIAFVESILQASRSYPEILIQETVPGEDYCVTGLFDQGECKAMMTYRNLVQYPHGKGFGILRETIEAPSMEDAARLLMRRVGWHGVAEIDFRWDGEETSTPALIEVNPRFWGGLFHSIESGLDYPWLLYCQTIGEKLPEDVRPSIGVQTKAPMFSVMTALNEILFQDVRMDELKSRLSEIKSDEDKGSFQMFKEQMHAWLESNPILHSLRSWMDTVKKGRGIPTEILSSNDPMASLGILYVLGSLARTGTLPEEFSRSGNYRESSHRDEEDQE